MTPLLLLKIVSILLLSWIFYYQVRRIDKLEKGLKKSFLDINSLQRNQNRLVLTIKELYRELRKRDKSLKRQIRVSPGSQETGPEES